ncbi:unnamed protein product [Ceutorhynchus assimilis]|uniref:Protein msta n=1 Tax=Ceutorhynchus assimilis TaxID=467358 RepID=A0A9N9N2P0_9CUCU|nr:unnamed protein product [Ceutorhynchus assimilis]
MSGQCEQCKQPSTQKCSKCKLVFYCSADHQKEHWNEHKNNCRSYEICSNIELGRYLIARRNLEKGEIIFVDTPIVVGPRPHKIDRGPFPCVGCCKLLLDQMASCPECGWPCCDPECPDLKNPQRHSLECQVLKLRSFKPDGSTTSHEFFRFDVLIILRALFLQKTNIKKWEALLNLEDHLDDRGPKSDIFKSIQEKVNFLLENYIAPLKLYEKETDQTILPQASNDIIHKIYGALDVNATELIEPADLYVLYPIASLLEHNCAPNTCQTTNNLDYKVTFRAAVPIKKNEHITTTYTNILWGTQERRKHLKETKYFFCLCNRCKDPTEFNTFFSALICLGNDDEGCKGIQLPQNPTQDNPDWVCNKCNIKLPNGEISNFVEHLKKEVDKEIDKKPKLEELEEFLNKLEVFLHANHYLVYTIKHSLVQLYKIDGEIEISNGFLQDKLKMCQELIDLTKKLDAGNTRLALYLAVLLNEQFMAKFKQLTRDFDPENKQASEDLIEEITKILEENKNCLEYEKQLETGAKLLQVIEFNEMKFKQWIMENSINL